MESVVATESEERERAREMLRREFGLESAFVRVPELSRVLGLAECTIYAAMRQGRFFIPHRVLLSSPAVRLDDLVDWYCSNQSCARRNERVGNAGGDRSAALDEDGWAELRRSVGRRGKISKASR